MKKKVLGLVVLIAFAFSFSVKASCNDNSYNVSSFENVVSEFTYHCCGGDKIEVTNVLTGETKTYIMPVGIHGGGSSCA